MSDLATIPAPTEPAPACSAEEARELVRTARESLVTFETAMSQIVARRAWEPLGYPSPREFVIAEFGPSDEDSTGRVTRVHAYRLARLVMFLFGLASRLGDDAIAFDMSERALRSIPADGGANDAIVIDRVEQRLSEMPDFTTEDAETVVKEEIARARDEIATHGRLDIPDDDLSSITVDPDLFVDDEVSEPTDEQTTTAADDESEERGNDTDVPAVARDAISDAYAPEPATGAALDTARDFTQMLASLAAITEVAPRLPGIVDAATDEELEELVRTATVAVEVCRQIHEAADDLL